MNRTVLHLCVVAILSIVLCSTTLGQVQLTVRADQPGAKISPTMYGIFFEDINFGADGGLYAELVKNRAFEFTEALMAWSEVKPAGVAGSLEVLKQDPFNAASPRYVRIKADTPGYGMVNEGFAGMGVKKGQEYIFSVYGRDAGSKVVLRVELISPDGRVLAKTTVRGFGAAWAKKSATLRPSATEAKAQLRVLLDAPGSVDLDMISLFPDETWKDRSNGLRADLVQWLTDLKPGFLRFPGGCIVEGRYLSTRYQWKNTIGKPEDRKLIINRWNDEFRHRPAPDYFQTFGLGFYEYFLLCEDIGAEPMPILNCGMACQFNSKELAPLDELQPYIQDALDLIEFANGPATSTWGAKRAEMGHPKPFNVKYLGVGNEQWGPQYIERYVPFVKALKNKYPEVQLIGATGSDPQIFPNGPKEVEFLQMKLKKLKADIIDEHFYRNPDWFLDSAGHYDSYERSGSKVFVGEYAAQSVGVASPNNRNNWKCALAEAAFMTGLERNADLVTMSCYAPLFGHLDRWQWTPDLIWFDNLQSYATPNYYVQQLFSLHRGDVLLPVEVTGQEPPTSKQPGLYVTSSRDEKANEIILKVVNGAPQATTVQVKIEGVRQVRRRGTAIVLAAEKLTDENTLAEPKRIAPVTNRLTGASASFEHTFPAYSVTVLRLKTKSSG
ncbi:MAG TPA: alpha-L-arabinofuranosidase C-terminal domain-containing protein [Sedimentisphaerales bacterium]|jgi:alpha-N-arabinofuranosidase|nr:alpha-L-arabinofuranosidase C-terminal domain-containing protein [Sedimentisphaerales bacterium]HNU29940.1 alpha-L-arabinofuranosidase C-terminal domain-containing protein [Sedimentisphaerales bacterium]